MHDPDGLPSLSRGLPLTRDGRSPSESALNSLEKIIVIQMDHPHRGRGVNPWTARDADHIHFFSSELDAFSVGYLPSRSKSKARP